VPFSAARLFDRPASPWGPGHRGIDVVAATGDAVLAPGDGIVTFAGVVVNRGVVAIDHGGTLRSSIEPVVPAVAVGDHVRAGDPLGVVSDEPGHCAPATCVHWGVRFGNDYVNPLDVLAGYGRIVLLP
jgi:murein DD-endopeptidase MepM/ murein hydrolase activator NlpD